MRTVHVNGVLVIDHRLPIDRPAVHGRYMDAARAAVQRAMYESQSPEERRKRNAAACAVRYAVATGRLTKPAVCSTADGTCSGRIEAHHHKGYDRADWLDVAWLCRRHHLAKHPRGMRRRRYDNSAEVATLVQRRVESYGLKSSCPAQEALK